jgi:hypothetical protein
MKDIFASTKQQIERWHVVTEPLTNDPTSQRHMIVSDPHTPTPYMDSFQNFYTFGSSTPEKREMMARGIAAFVNELNKPKQ